MRNPPWTLPLVFPFGFLSPRVGWPLWLLLLLACLVVSVHMLWIMHGRPPNRRYLLGYSFGPALVCLIYGQTSLFALLGLVLFLRLHRTNPFWAGISLWLCALKPQLFLPFGAAVLAWVLVSRSYKLLAGAAAALAASSAIAFLIDPLAWAQYSQMMRTSGIDREYIPCLSYLLRYWISPNSIWLQYLPAVLGSAWALGYFWHRRQTWDWLKDGSPVMLVSILAAPYSWIYDQGLAIPALLQAAFQTRFRGLLVALAFLSALVEGALFRSISHPAAMALWTYWSAPAWLVWYFFATCPAGKGPGKP
ncbi:MAG: glycosyltransferase 87 family protein [Terracidiphilus sp.]